MKQLKLITILVILSHSVSAQKITDEYATIDGKVLQIPDSLTRTVKDLAGYITSNFGKEEDKGRAIFIWIATNIQYDIDNMFAINFYEKEEEKVSKPLKNRKGICENYAALFKEVCLKAGLKSYVVEGYTKQNGFADYIPHAWCATLIDSSWFMFDPTWGSGYVSNGRFYKKINNAYFKATPANLIKSHMPFDFLWQFLNYPITNQEFYEGKTQQNKTKPFFSYPDSIQVYDKQSVIEQLISSADRIERNGVKNAMIFDRLRHIKLEIENYRQSQTVNLYNAAGVDYNEGVSKLNEFIQYRNQQFEPYKPDWAIQEMIDAADKKFNEAEAKLNSIKNPDGNIISMILQLKKLIDDATAQVTEQQNWLKVYFSRGKSGRRSMFYERKVTWFGTPIK